MELKTFHEAMLKLYNFNLTQFSKIFYDADYDNESPSRQEYLMAKFRIYRRDPLRAILDLDLSNLRRFKDYIFPEQ